MNRNEINSNVETTTQPETLTTSATPTSAELIANHAGVEAGPKLLDYLRAMCDAIRTM